MRKEFKALLDRCVEEGEITRAEANELLRQWDAGSISKRFLPLSAEEGVTPVVKADIDAAIEALKKEGINIRP